MTNVLNVIYPSGVIKKDFLSNLLINIDYYVAVATESFTNCTFFPDTDPNTHFTFIAEGQYFHILYCCQYQILFLTIKTINYKWIVFMVKNRIKKLLTISVLSGICKCKTEKNNPIDFTLLLYDVNKLFIIKLWIK